MIGIYGGTFDPVHYGHLRTAMDILQDLPIDSIRMIPCHQPPHRDQPVASPDIRLKMLVTAVQGIEELQVDTRELDRGGVSYMVDTLVSLNQDFSNETFCLLIGMDAFVGFASWKSWQNILDMCHLVVMQRPGVALDIPAELKNDYASRSVSNMQHLGEKTAGSILVHPVTQMDISASRIRGLVQSGKSPKFLLPDAVLSIIEENHLYM